jgi:hypothetical protein
MNQDDVGRFDQSAAFIADSLPALWRRMYDRLREEGFDAEQAMLLLRTYVHASFGGKLEK